MYGGQEIIMEILDWWLDREEDGYSWWKITYDYRGINKKTEMPYYPSEEPEEWEMLAYIISEENTLKDMISYMTDEEEEEEKKSPDSNI